MQLEESLGTVLGGVAAGSLDGTQLVVGFLKACSLVSTVSWPH